MTWTPNPIYNCHLIRIYLYSQQQLRQVQPHVPLTTELHNRRARRDSLMLTAPIRPRVDDQQPAAILRNIRKHKSLTGLGSSGLSKGTTSSAHEKTAPPTTLPTVALTTSPSQENSIKVVANPLFGKLHPLQPPSQLKGVGSLAQTVELGSLSLSSMGSAEDLDDFSGSMSDRPCDPVRVALCEKLRFVSRKPTLDEALASGNVILELSAFDQTAVYPISDQMADLSMKVLQLGVTYLKVDPRVDAMILNIVDALSNYSHLPPLNLFVAKLMHHKGIFALLRLALSKLSSDLIFTRTVSFLAQLSLSSREALENLIAGGCEYLILQAAASDLPCQEIALSLLSSILASPTFRGALLQRQYQNALMDFLLNKEIKNLCPVVSLSDISIPRQQKSSLESPAMFGHLPVSMQTITYAQHSFSEAMFHTAVDFMSLINHPNVLPIYGACFTPSSGSRFFLTPYFRRGTLFKFLFNSSPPPVSTSPACSSSPMPASNSSSTGLSTSAEALGPSGSNPRSLLNSEMTWASLTQISEGTAEGLRWLHSNCIHSPISTDRIFLADDFSPKVMLAFDIDIPSRYLPPEHRRGESVSVTEASNVYSYSKIVYELLTSTEAPEDPATPKIPHQCPPSLSQLLHRCWLPSPDQRPTFSQILAFWQRFRTWMDRTHQESNLPQLFVLQSEARRSES